MVNLLFSQYNFHENWARDTVSKYIDCNDKVLIIPFSFGDGIRDDTDWQGAYQKDRGSYYGSVIAPFLSYEVKEENISWLNYFKDTKQDAKIMVKNSDIIFFTGGLPDRMMCRLTEFELTDEIENFAGTIIGSSAGALIQLKEYHISPDKDYDTFSYNSGLNRIREFGIEVHYEETEMQKNYIDKVLKEKRDKVYAIKDTGGIVVENKTVILLGDVETFNRQ